MHSAVLRKLHKYASFTATQNSLQTLTLYRKLGHKWGVGILLQDYGILALCNTFLVLLPEVLTGSAQAYV